MMGAPKNEFLTIELTRDWLRATEAERAYETARLRAMIVDRVLQDVVTRVRWGLSLQCAGDEVWRRQGKYAPSDVKRIVSEALEGIGWIRSGRKAEK